MYVLQSEHMPRIFTQVTPFKSGFMKVQKETIKLCNETRDVIQLLVAPDPNQVMLMELGGGVSADISGAGISCNAVRRFVPKDSRTSKKFLPPGAAEKLRLASPKVFVTVLSDDSLKSWDTDLVMQWGDTIRIYVNNTQFA
jgi:hypothetical protein